VKIELYNQPTNNHEPQDSSGNAITPVSWSPLPCVAGGQTGYNGGEDAAQCGDPRAAAMIAFPWSEWTHTTGLDGAGGVFFGANPSTDPQGVGPFQNWFVVQGLDSFHFEFGQKGMFGAPTTLSGEVPQIYATWINGLTPGRYYARAWVFRYVQSALDGATFQEYSFQVGANEWAGDISLPIDLRVSSWINKTVHFHDNAGTLVTSPISTGATMVVGTLNDASTGVLYSYNTTIITPFMQANGNSYVTFYGFNDTWLGQNYGIPAGTYKPKTQAMGYIQQTQDLVSVTLSGTPVDISNHLYRGVGFNFTAYSIDWEMPRVNRQWVWPGQDIGIGIFDSKGNFVDDACYFCNGFYSGLVNPAVQNSTAGNYFTEFQGTGVGNAYGVWFGQDDRYSQFNYDTPGHIGFYVGGRMSETTGKFTTGGAKNAWGLFTSGLLYPTAIDSGQYSFMGWTYGYIQDKQFSVYANKGQIADMKINLIIGVNITLDILFKKEHIISGTPYNMSARVRVFDDSGNLVATWMSSEGVYGNATGTYHSNVFQTGRAVGAEGTSQYPFDLGLNYLPGGVNLLHLKLAGLPMAPETAYGYGPDLGTTYGDPVFTPGAGDFELDMWPISATMFPNEGILGQPDYTGTGWTAEVDFVNWYMNDTILSNPLDPFADAGTLAPKANGYWSNFYPVVPGLLMGESYHIIPGYAPQLSLTENGALNANFLGHSMAANHLGPYSQEAIWSLTSAHNSGETSGIWEVDLNGYLTGTALAFTWSNEFRTISWYTVSVVGAANGSLPMLSYTNDGMYEFYLVPGQYSMTLSGPGYAATPMGSISVTSGQTSTPGAGVNVGLPPTNIPVPEFSGIAIVAFSALAASLYLLRRRRR